MTISLNLFSKPISKQMETSSQPITTINSRFSPWLLPLCYFLCQVILPLFFRRIEITGQENLPREDAVVRLTDRAGMAFWLPLPQAVWSPDATCTLW
jgi:hypothetical protein